MKQIDIARNSGGGQQFVERGPSGDVPFAACHALRGQETADATLEVG